MAEGKKSFVLYSDLGKDIEKLSNEHAGILIVQIFEFANDPENHVNRLPTVELLKIYNTVIEGIKYEWSKYNPKTGKYHWNYQGGITDDNKAFRNSTAYKLWRQDVFVRDNFTCQECGNYGGELNAHHKLSFADYPDLRLWVDNGLTLCKPCHKKEHSK